MGVTVADQSRGRDTGNWEAMLFVVLVFTVGVVIGRGTYGLGKTATACAHACAAASASHWEFDGQICRCSQ